MKELKYLNAVLRETIRLYPTAPIFNLKSRSKESHFRLGEYLVPSDTVLRINVSSVHRDPSVYGQDANEFKPERMLDGKFKALPKNAWKVNTVIVLGVLLNDSVLALWKRYASLHRAHIRLARGSLGHGCSSSAL